MGLFSITMLPPALVAIYYKDGGGTAFIQAFVVSLILGFIFGIPIASISRSCAPAKAS